MSKVIYLVSVLTVLYSCDKHNNTYGDQRNPSLNAVGSVSYKANGNLVIIDNANQLDSERVSLVKQSGGMIMTSTRYLLNAKNGVNNVLGFPIITDSLQVTNYHYDSTAVNFNLFQFSFTFDYNGHNSDVVYSGDYLDVIISSYKNGLVTGTFSGKLTPSANSDNYNLKGTTIITEGKITNVPVTY